jgi:hypothetical protein
MSDDLRAGACRLRGSSFLILISNKGGNPMFLLLAIILILMFGGGLFFHILGSAIYIFLVLALISFIYHFIAGRRAV